MPVAGRRGGGRAGARVAALATSPVPVVPQLVREGRYLAMARAFGLTADEQLTCGCHVHVGISSAEEGVAVLDRIRPWLAVLLALSANSPFWQGRDSAYASFRYQAWSRWPTAGPTDAFGSAEAYQQTVQKMVRTGTLLDTGMLYFDARLSEHFPTLEIRISDVCLYADDAVLIAALARGLVETEARRWRAGEDTGAAPHRAAAPRRLAGQPLGLDDVLVSPLHRPARTGLGGGQRAGRARPGRAGRGRRHRHRHRAAGRGAGPRERIGLPAKALRGTAACPA